MNLVWMVLATFVLSVIRCGGIGSCENIVGPPDGRGIWQFMEYAHGMQLDLDGPRTGGVRVFVDQTEYKMYGFWTTVQVTYRDGEGNYLYVESERIPPGRGVVEVGGPPDGRLWEYVVVQGGDIIGFSVDAVETMGVTYRAFLPIVGGGNR